MKASIPILSLLATGALSREIPANVKSLYKSIVSKGQCSKILKTGFFSSENDSKGMSFA